MIMARPQTNLQYQLEKLLSSWTGKPVPRPYILLDIKTQVPRRAVLEITEAQRNAKLITIPISVVPTPWRTWSDYFDDLEATISVYAQKNGLKVEVRRDTLDIRPLKTRGTTYIPEENNG
jgi:hypothetical protein